MEATTSVAPMVVLDRVHEVYVAAHRAFAEAVKYAFPVASTATCIRGKGCFDVEIVGHSDVRFDEVRIRNLSTGATYWVHYSYLHNVEVD